MAFSSIVASLMGGNWRTFIENYQNHPGEAILNCSALSDEASVCAIYCWKSV
jgi:hypothetical protein